MENIHNLSDSAVHGTPYPFEELQVREDGYLMPDVYLLRHTDKMLKLYGATNTQQFFDILNSQLRRPQLLDNLRGNLSDEDIMSSIKSKSCQTFAEVEGYLESLRYRLDSRAAAAAEKQTKSSEDEQENQDTSESAQ